MKPDPLVNLLDGPEFTNAVWDSAQSFALANLYSHLPFTYQSAWREAYSRWDWGWFLETVVNRMDDWQIAPVNPQMFVDTFGEMVTA